MYKKKFYFLTSSFFLASLPAFGQQIEWANEVIEFSSEISPIEFSAEQATGKPNIYPVGSENPNGWLPSKPNKKEFLKLGFKNPIHVSQIAIAESYQPGGISDLYLYDLNNKEHLVFSFEPKPVNQSRRMLNVFFDKTTFKAKAIKIALNNQKMKKWTAIDAVAITDTSSPIIIEVHLEDGINTNVVSEKLSEEVNSKYAEINPVIDSTGTSLYFTRTNHPDNSGGKENVWVSTRDNPKSEWQESKNMKNLNAMGVTSIISVTPDGKSMLVKVKEGNTTSIATIEKTSEEWSKPRAFNIQDFDNSSDDVDYYLANNRRVLIISAKVKDEGYGGKDLYVSLIEEDGAWSRPKNLGNILNTALSETSPFLAKDDKTLYFSSDGYAGFGGADVYVSKRLDDTWTNWSSPKNMGPGINKENDDAFFNISADNNEAFFVRLSEQKNDADIFTMNIPELYRAKNTVKVYGKVLDMSTKKTLNATIIYENINTGKIVGKANADPVTGEFEIHLPSGVEYGYLAKSKGFISRSSNIFPKKGESYELKRNIYMIPLKKNEVIELKNIFFKPGKENLEQKSFNELDRIYQTMSNNPTMKIRISGHTDAAGTVKSNLHLSKQRAFSVKKYLIDKGINPERVSAKGYGSSRPLVEENTEEDRRKNRRVEMKILKY